MNSEMDRLKESFREEAAELLAELEASLLELEGSGQNTELISRVFRALHNIKGLGSMFKYDEMAGFAHELETAFDVLRSGGATVSKEIIDLGLSAKDLIRTMLKAQGHKSAKSRKKAQEIIDALHLLIPLESVPPARKSPEEEGGRDAPPKGAVYLVRFRPGRDIFLSGINPLGILRELRGLGDCLVMARTEAVPPLGDINPELCYLSWDAVLRTDRGEDAIREAFVFVEGRAGLHIDVIWEKGDELGEDDFRAIGEAMGSGGDVSPEGLRGLIGELKGAPETDAGVVEQAAEGKGPASSIRVSSEKLDKLAGVVGELVTLQARLSQTASLRTDPELQILSEEIKRLTEDIRDHTTSIRMVPIGAAFGKLRRLVRDLSAELGKDVRLVAEGSETELDKSLIERLSDPLMHIIRNAVDHGIEPPGRRGGKPRQGTIHLRAEHSGGCVLIHVADDGAGIDREAVRARALEKGLIDEGAELSDEQVYNLIFAPGFSSKKEVSSVSGRGVGLDVVKRAVEALRGSIRVRSEKGAGTTITLKLPLTLAIIDGLLVNIGGEKFVFPLSSVEECVEIMREEIGRNGRHMAVIRGEIVPYVHLGRWFMLEGDGPRIQQLVITGRNGDRVGFVVDQVVGEHQTVIKSLGDIYRGVEGISGATILGDGTVALLLDVKSLVNAVRREEKACLGKGR